MLAIHSALKLLCLFKSNRTDSFSSDRLHLSVGEISADFRFKCILIFGVRLNVVSTSDIGKAVKVISGAHQKFQMSADRGGWGYSDKWGYFDNLCLKY